MKGVVEREYQLGIGVDLYPGFTSGRWYDVREEEV
jgi:hypothetical protein